MRSRSLLAVTMFLAFVTASFAQQPIIPDYCSVKTIQDNTWALGVFGTSTITGYPSAEKDVASRELVNYTQAIRSWTTKEAASFWFSGWRTSKLTTHYQDNAKALDEALAAWNRADSKSRDYASKVAASYRQIAELLALRDTLGNEKVSTKLISLTEDMRDAELRATGSSKLNEKDVKQILGSYFASR